MPQRIFVSLVVVSLTALLTGCASSDPHSPVADVPAVDASPDVPAVDASPDERAVDARVVDDVPTAGDAPIAVDASIAVDVPIADDASIARDATADVDDATIACGPGYTCPEGFRCVGLSTVRCVRTVALGAPCRNGDDPIYCALSASCEPSPDGPRCAAYGALDGVCRNTDGCSPRCDAGLGCDLTTHCRPGLDAGALCGGPRDHCNEGASCQVVSGTARCLADGASGGYCRVGRTCDTGLRCEGVNSGSAVGCNREYFHCLAGPRAGEACDPAGARCIDGTACVTIDGATRCAATPDGAPGGRCRETTPRCDGDTVCTRSSRCLRPIARGMACDPSDGASACADGDTCSAEHTADDGRCVAAGTAPGAECRTSGAACDGALTCSTFSRYRRTCRVEARAGDACDLGAVQVLCPPTTRCVPETVTAAGSVVARCTAPVAEVEPNERTSSARVALTRSTRVQATLDERDVEDCHVVRASAGAALFVEGPAGLVASLYRASGVEAGRWTLSAAAGDGPLAGSARLDPAQIGALRDLAAEDYQLCVRAPEPLRVAFVYTLTIGVLPRVW